MTYGKYRPFVVALSVSLLWIIYLFFSNFSWQQYVLETIRNSVRAELLPVLDTIENQYKPHLSLMQKVAGAVMPYYGYVCSENQDVVTVNMIGMDDMWEENTGEILDENIAKEAWKEGNAAASGMTDGTIANGDHNSSNTDGSLDTSVISRNAASGTVYNRADLFNNDFLRSHFYTVTSVTSLDNQMLRAEEFLNKDLSISHDNSTPQILIFHTHSQETFVDSVEGDTETTIVGVGNYLTKLLTEKYGYNVIHDTSIYDFVNGTLDRSKAYTYAEQGVQAILDANPSIDVVIDLHRDGVAETTRLITEADGKQMAKIMFFNGVSYSNVNGNIDYLYNPNRDDNLAMSLQMQLLGEAYYPGFLRNIYINAYRYCLHMRGKSMLIEAGAQTNTVQEVKNSMEPLADMLDKLLRGEKAY